MLVDEANPAVTRARAGWWRLGLATRLRCAIAVLSMVVGGVEGHLVDVLPWAAAVMALEVGGDRVRGLLARRAVLWASTALVGAALLSTVDDTVAVLPLLLVPAYRAGGQHGRTSAAGIPLALGAAAALTAWWHQEQVTVVALVQWWVLAVGLAQLGAWERRLVLDRSAPDTSAAREAGRLLARVQDLARQLPTGLDVPAVASMLLDDVRERVPADRAAVLVRVADDQLSPVALTGAERVPWRDPVQSPGTMHEAWTRRTVVNDLRPADASGRRRGSAMLALPLSDLGSDLLGLVVLERATPTAFTPEEVSLATDAARRLAPHLQAALAFSELRHTSEVGERERLAREMHDGVAQDLSALGFSLDAATKRVALVDTAVATSLREVRTELNRTIRDIRLSISDLRSSVHSERGLGAAISSHVQSLGSGSDIAVTVSLQESPFRLPSHHESVLLRLVQDFLGDTRARGSASALTVELDCHPPNARLRLSRTGGGDWRPDELLVSALQSLGGQLHMVESDGRILGVIELGSTTDAAPSEATPAAQHDGHVPRLARRVRQAASVSS